MAKQDHSVHDPKFGSAFMQDLQQPLPKHARLFQALSVVFSKIVTQQPHINLYCSEHLVAGCKHTTTTSASC